MVQISFIFVVELKISQSSQNVTSCYQRPFQVNLFVLSLSQTFAT